MKRAIRNFSVSQLETFGTEAEPGCPRKHYFSWILGMKGPPTDAQARGTAVHESIAQYITQGKSPPPEHEIYLRAVEPWFPQGDYSVEHELRLGTHLGIPWIGYIDLICEGEPTILIDWKTTSDLRYAKTPAELYGSLQLGVYAHYAYELGVQGTVRAGLVYIEVPKTPPKKKAKVLPVFIDLTREHAQSIWDGTKPVLDQMLEVSALDDPQDVPCNTAICGKYGGCPYRSECGISMFSGIAASGSHTPAKNKEIASMSFLDKLREKSNGTAAPPQAAPSPPPVAGKPPGRATRSAAAPKPDAAAPAATKPASGFLSRRSAPAETGVVPPDAPPRETPMDGALPHGQDTLGDADGEGGEVQEIGPAPLVPPEQQTRGRGRPKGSTNAARAGLTLYIDCLVVKGRGEVEPTDFADWWAPIEMELNELAMTEEKLPSFWLLGFGPQKAALAIKVQEKIAKGLPASMLVNSSAPMAREVLPMLLPHATTVIRALRG